MLRKNYREHLSQEEAFSHAILFIEGQKKKNKEIDELKNEISTLKKDYNLEIKSMFYEMNKMKEEIASLKSKSKRPLVNEEPHF